MARLSDAQPQIKFGQFGSDLGKLNSTAPNYLLLPSTVAGVDRFLFMDTSNNIRVSTTEPTANSDGTIIAPSTGGTRYMQVAKDTNATTPVNVIAATVPFTATITGIFLVSKDTTAGNITIADTTGTVATIAKGVTAGALVGATSLANTTVTSGDTLTIVSSSAGNATVFITFTV